MNAYPILVNQLNFSIGVFDSIQDAKSYFHNEYNFHLLVVDLRLLNSDLVGFVTKLNDFNIPVIYIGGTIKEFDFAGEVSILNDLLVQPITISKLVATITFALDFAARIHHLASNISGLEGKLTTDCLINVVTGITMERNKVSKEEALGLLISAAKRERKLLEDFCMTILESAELSYSTINHLPPTQ